MTGLLLLLLSGPAQASEPRPVPEAAAPLTLAGALEQARSRSPTVAAARVRAEGADAAARTAGRLGPLSLDLRTENWRSGGDFDAWDELDVFAVATQPLELTGIRGGRSAAAAGRRDAARARWLDARRRLELDTVRGYLAVLQGRERVTAEAERVEGLAQIVRRLTRQVDEGYAPRADLMKFQSEETLASLRWERTRIELDRDTARLEVLLGLPLGGRSLVAPEPLPVPEGDPDTLARAALGSHPGLEEARALHATALGQLAVERAQRNPDLGLAAGWKRTGGLDTGVVGLVVSVPLFDRNSRGVAEATAAERAAALELEWVRESLAAEIASRIRAARLLGARARNVGEELLAPAAGAREAALSGFREGRSDALTLLDAERVYAEARREALELQAEAFAAAYEVRLLTGREDAP